MVTTFAYNTKLTSEDYLLCRQVLDSILKQLDNTEDHHILTSKLLLENYLSDATGATVNLGSNKVTAFIGNLKQLVYKNA